MYAFTAENWHDFDGSDPTEPPTGTGDATDKSRDRVTRFVYNGLDQLALLVALDMNADGTLDDNQTTRYLYEDLVAANRVTSEIYPDSSDTTSSGTDQVKLAYALDGRQTSRTDQRGVVIEMTYNARRQLELADATSLGGSGFVDDFVRSIERSYDTLGRLTLITSYAAAGGTGTIRNQVALEYNGLDQVTASEQSHAGAVDDSPRVEYVYDDSAGSGRYLHQHRLSEVVYPAGRTVHHDYGSGRTDRLGLVAALRETDGMGTAWTSYSYNGTGRLALAAYPEVSVALDYFQGTAGTYAGWDRFGRVIDQRWTGAMDDLDRFGYGYDAAGSRLWRDLDDAVYATDDLDQVFGYDGLHRLVTSEEGTFDGTGIDGMPVREEAWTLDALGNWAALEQEEAGQSVLSQTRTHNEANEIGNISGWGNVAHDAAGNMSSMPRPGSWASATWACKYDAWNRLAQVLDLSMGINTVARYEYDGLNRRVVKNVFDGGSLDHRLHFYYNESWQVLEVRKEESSVESPDPVEQFIWHPYYIDALAVRFWDAAADGMAIEQHYFTHDANFNVTAALDDSGDAVERYHYSPYGEVTFLDDAFDPIAESAIDNNHLFTGRERDPETGLQLNRNRYYHPTLGRWSSRDPIGYRGGAANLYLA